MHPGVKDYTHYSHLHHTYCRIDYFFIDHHHLTPPTASNIATTPISDHAMITLTLSIPSMPCKPSNWKLSDHLLSDDIDRKMLHGDLARNFADNTLPDVAPGTLWEAHKAFIRGKLIELGSRKKKERTSKQLDLIRDIEALERQHKAGHSQTIFWALKALFHLEQKQVFHIVAQRLHEWGNRPGRLLARSLQQKSLQPLSLGLKLHVTLWFMRRPP